MKRSRSDLPRWSDYDTWAGAHLLPRRQVIGLGIVIGGALVSSMARAAGASGGAFSKQSEADVARPYPNVHGGAGTISVRYFPFDKQPSPAHFVIYDIPPGASEGVHTHHLGDTALGPYDEYYYIIEGQGEMPIDGKTVAVKAGDHVHTPLGVAHGITNTLRDGNLKVFLTFIAR
jgi:quercetin dioxygenase-like cupin family protein